MKRFLLTLVTAVALTMSASAMSYTTARDQALFLTDKMAYELNLTDDQYNAVYEINLDYMLSVASQNDLFGSYWTRRNTDLGYVLSTIQYNLFAAQSYFYRPITWVSNRFYYPIYKSYSKGRFFREAPAGYNTYRGANRYYERSPYSGRTFYTKGSEPQPRGQQGGQAQKGNQGGQQPQGGQAQKGNQGGQQPQGGQAGKGNQGGSKSNGGQAQKGNQGASKSQGSSRSDFQYNKRQSVNQGQKQYGGANQGGRRR